MYYSGDPDRGTETDMQTIHDQIRGTSIFLAPGSFDTNDDLYNIRVEAEKDDFETMPVVS